MAVSGADRQQAYRQRQREASARQAEEIETLRTELSALRLRLAQSADQNAALKAELSRARQQAQPTHKPPRRPRDLAQHLYPTVRRSEQR